VTTVDRFSSQRKWLLPRTGGVFMSRQTLLRCSPVGASVDVRASAGAPMRRELRELVCVWRENRRGYQRIVAS